MQASPVEGQLLQPKEKEKRKKEDEKKIPKRRRSLSCQNFDFCACPSLNVVKRDVGGKKGKMLCCKRIFDRTKAIWPRSSLKSTKMSKKRIFSKKFQESMG